MGHALTESCKNDHTRSCMRARSPWMTTHADRACAHRNSEDDHTRSCMRALAVDDHARRWGMRSPKLVRTITRSHAQLHTRARRGCRTTHAGGACAHRYSEDDHTRSCMALRALAVCCQACSDADARRRQCRRCCRRAATRMRAVACTDEQRRVCALLPLLPSSDADGRRRQCG
jgi:hypothetical protein